MTAKLQIAIVSRDRLAIAYKLLEVEFNFKLFTAIYNVEYAMQYCHCEYQKKKIVIVE